MLSTGASRPLLISRMYPSCFFQSGGSQCSVFTGVTPSSLSYSTFSCLLLRLCEDNGKVSVSVFGWQPPEWTQGRENKKYLTQHGKTERKYTTRQKVCRHPNKVWALIWCYNSLHYSGKTTHQVSAFQFIPVLLDVALSFWNRTGSSLNCCNKPGGTLLSTTAVCKRFSLSLVKSKQYLLLTPPHRLHIYI